MRVRRRSALLSAAFLTLATLTAGPTTVTAQPPPIFQPQEPFGQPVPPLPRSSNFNPGEPLTPDQVRQALLRLSGQAGDFPKDLSPFAEAVKQQVLKQNPNIDPNLLNNAIRKIVNDPEKMKQLREIAGKQAASGGKTPAGDDIAKMFRNFTNDVPGVPPDLAKQLGRQFGQGIPTPPPDPGRVAPSPPPPFGGGFPPNFPQPDPGRVQPPVPTPDPGRVQPMPVPGKTDPPRPTPPEPGKTDPVKPPVPNNVTPPDPPPAARPPQTGNPPPPAAHPDRPADPFERTPEDMARGKALRALAGAWERNIGPLKDTPAVQRALTELVTGVGDMKDADGNSIWDAFEKNLGDGEGFANWLNGASLGGDWKMPSFNMPSWNFGGSGLDIGGGSSSSRRSWWNRGSSPRSGSGSSGGGFGIPGLEGTWLPVVLLAAVLLGALIWWRFVYLRDPARLTSEFAIAGLGPWPIDPNRIASREDVVRAFEYLSVLICGPEAKTWTHATIAELTGLARTHGEAAIMLARLYELARYAPLSEPLTTAELAEARRLVCGLAGVAQV